jgi:hypothetical protein
VFKIKHEALIFRYFNSLRKNHCSRRRARGCGFAALITGGTA